MQRPFAVVMAVACVVIYSWLCTWMVPLLALRAEPVLVGAGSLHPRGRTPASRPRSREWNPTDELAAFAAHANAPGVTGQRDYDA